MAHGLPVPCSTGMCENGHIIQVRSCGAHSAGILKPSCFGVLEVVRLDIFPILINCLVEQFAVNSI
jgi:hypothetical protein